MREKSKGSWKKNVVKLRLVSPMCSLISFLSGTHKTHSKTNTQEGKQGGKKCGLLFIQDQFLHTPGREKKSHVNVRNTLQKETS